MRRRSDIFAYRSFYDAYCYGKSPNNPIISIAQVHAYSVDKPHSKAEEQTITNKDFHKGGHYTPFLLQSQANNRTHNETKTSKDVPVLRNHPKAHDYSTVGTSGSLSF